MKVVIKSWLCHDGITVVPIEEYKPADLTDVYTDSMLQIGPPDSQGSEDFTLTVCTIKGLQWKLKKEQVAYSSGHGLIIFEEYNFEALKKLVEARIRKAESYGSFDEVMSDFRRFARWESEDLHYLSDEEFEEAWTEEDERLFGPIK